MSDVLKIILVALLTWAILLYAFIEHLKIVRLEDRVKVIEAIIRGRQ